MPYTITLSRIYDAIHEPAGKTARVLTDRLWPRGLSKDELGDIQWLHDASPATEAKVRATRIVRIRPSRSETTAHTGCITP